MNMLQSNLVLPGTGVPQPPGQQQQDPYTMSMGPPVMAMPQPPFYPQDPYGTYQSIVPPMAGMQQLPLIPQGGTGQVAEDRPYFAENRLHVPRAGWIPALPANSAHARSVAGRTNRSQKARGLGDVSRDITEDQMKQIKKKLIPELRRELAGHFEQEKEEKEAVLESKWFGLPENTYGAGIWSILVLEVEATGLDLLFRWRDSKDVPMNQRWPKEDSLGKRVFVDIYQWFIKRFFPFLRSIYFQLSTVVLTAVSWLLQFGFTYSIDVEIGGYTFFENDNSRNICATSGWVQYMSVGFFLAFMLGQVPHLLRNLLLIWTSDKETDESRGEDKAKHLWVDGSPEHVRRMLQEAKMYTPSMEGMLPEARSNFIHRTYASHIVRRMICTLFPLAEASIIGYLMYVGVKYIFWSGFSALESTKQEFWPNFVPGDDFLYPWMTNTGGVEEIIMATLALQFIIEIDEAIFSLVLPKSIQNSVSETRLNCRGWLPTSFRRSDFINIGKHEYERSHETKEGEEGASPEHAAERNMAKDEEYEESDQWICGFLRLKVLQSINQTYSLILQEEAQEKKSEARAENVYAACCGSKMNQYNMMHPMESYNFDEEIKRQTMQEKKDLREAQKKKYQPIFEGGYFWKLYCRAMRDTLTIARFIDDVANEEGELERSDKDYKKKKATIDETKESVFRNMYYEFDDGNYLWMDLDAQFWEEDNLDEKPEDKARLDGFLLEVALKVGNRLLAAANKDPIINLGAGGAGGAVSTQGKSRLTEATESSSESEDDSEYSWAMTYSEDQEIADEKREETQQMLERCNEELSAVVSSEEALPQRKKLYRTMKSECSNMINTAEEFVSKPVRQQWMNLLPDATFLLTFVLLALPGLLVVYVRSRVGCSNWNAVPLDELEELEALTNTEVLEDKAGQFTTPMVVVVVIASLSALVLAYNTFKIWIEEENKEARLGSRLLAANKKKTQATEDGP